MPVYVTVASTLVTAGLPPFKAAPQASTTRGSASRCAIPTISAVSVQRKVWPSPTTFVEQGTTGRKMPLQHNTVPANGGLSHSCLSHPIRLPRRASNSAQPSPARGNRDFNLARKCEAQLHTPLTGQTLAAPRQGDYSITCLVCVTV